MKPHLLCIGGVDHALRIPFLLALQNCGFQVTAAGTGDPTPFARAGLCYHPFGFDRFVNPAADWVALKTISKLLAAVRPQLVQSFDTKPNLLMPLAARQFGDLRVIRTINGLGWTYSTRSLMALAHRPAYCALHRMTARFTAATIFQNRDDQTFFERKQMVGPGENRLIPGSGIDVEGFARAKASGPCPTQLRQALDLGQSELVITVTRMTRQKGIPTLLRAAALVHAARPGVRFLLVGPRQSEGPSAISQAEIDRHLPYVIAIGQRSDIPALLGIADVFAFPTEYREGVPRALLEAALAGLPIVATSVPGCSDVVRNGWNGYLVPPGEPRVLASKILDLLRDRQTAKAMAARAADFVKREFSLAIVVDRYAAVYAQLADRSVQGRIQITNNMFDCKPQPGKACP